MMPAPCSSSTLLARICLIALRCRTFVPSFVVNLGKDRLRNAVAEEQIGSSINSQLSRALSGYMGILVRIGAFAIVNDDEYLLP